MFAPLMPVPAIASVKRDPEVFMIVGAAIVVLAVLVCACSVFVLRRRSHPRG